MQVNLLGLTLTGSSIIVLIALWIIGNALWHRIISLILFFLIFGGAYLAYIHHLTTPSAFINYLTTHGPEIGHQVIKLVESLPVLILKLPDLVGAGLDWLQKTISQV